MKYYEMPYHEITNVKPTASYYIDDKAIHFDNWTKVLKKVI
jgi:predicted phosphatase